MRSGNSQRRPARDDRLALASASRNRAAAPDFGRRIAVIIEKEPIVPHRPKIIAAFTALGLAAAFVSGCGAPSSAPPPSGPIPISRQTDAALTAYLRKVRVTRPGAFAVSPDGRNSFYTWCDDTACAVANYSMPALRGCQSQIGTPCLILFVRDEPRLAFTRIGEDAPGRHGSEQQRRVDFDVRDR